MLLHATHQWPDAITLHLWPYALKMANEIGNIMPRGQDGLIPMDLFSKSSQVQQIDHLHPFGCLGYVWESKLLPKQKMEAEEPDRDLFGPINAACKNGPPGFINQNRIDITTISCTILWFLWNNKVERIPTQVRMATKGKTHQTSSQQFTWFWCRSNHQEKNQSSPDHNQ